MKMTSMLAALGLAAPIYAEAQVIELPLSADHCAISYALTLEQHAGCPPPGNLGASRAAEAGTAADAAMEKKPAETKAEMGYYIRFDFGSDTLSKKYRDHLSSLSEVLTAGELKSLCIKLVGHTDAVGPEEVNLALSKKRAKSVHAFMTGDMKMKPERLLTEGAGETQLLDGVPGTDSRNRRVEVLARQGENGVCTT